VLCVIFVEVFTLKTLKMLWKKKKKTNVIDLMYGKEVVYRAILSPDYVQFESASRDWLIRYSSATPEAGLANTLIKEERLEELTAWVRIQYLMRIETRYITMSDYRTRRFIETIKGKSAEIYKVVPKSKQSDEEILSEEKVKSEQTAESIMELEAVKKKGKKK
jgi:hypothetical protein